MQISWICFAFSFLTSSPHVLHIAASLSYGEASTAAKCGLVLLDTFAGWILGESSPYSHPKPVKTSSLCSLQPAWCTQISAWVSCSQSPGHTHLGPQHPRMHLNSHLGGVRLGLMLSAPAIQGSIWERWVGPEWSLGICSRILMLSGLHKTPSLAPCCCVLASGHELEALGAPPAYLSSSDLEWKGGDLCHLFLGRKGPE